MFPDKDTTLKSEKEEWTLPLKDILEERISNREEKKCLSGGVGFLLSVKCCTDNNIDSCIETVSLLA